MPAQPIPVSIDSSAPGHPLPAARWLGLVALLITELLVVGVMFDGEVLADQTGEWARVVEVAPRFVMYCIAILGSLIIVGRRAIWSEFVQAYERVSQFHGWTWPLAGHLATFAAFIGVTHLLLGGKLRSTGDATTWALVWGALAIATVGLWALSGLSARAWAEWTWNSRKMFVVAIPVGLGATALASYTGRIGWNFLAVLTLRIVHVLLSLTFTDVIYEPADAVIGTPSFQVAIAPQCGGYEGIVLISVFLAGYLWWARKQLRFPQALLLLPVGIATIWLANTIRIVLAIVIGSAGWPAVARGGFHSHAGWLAFNGIALGIVALSGQIRWLAMGYRTRSVTSTRNPTSAYLAPFLGIVATAMITGAFSAGFDWLYGVRVLVAAGLLSYFWRSYSELRWSWDWQPIALGAVAFAAWLLLAPSGGAAGAPEPLQTASKFWVHTWIAVRVIGYLITAPLAEELAFRGFLMRRFASADFEQVPLNNLHWVGFVGTSVLFGLMHGQSWFPATVAGVVFALAAYRKGNLADAVIAHITTNALVLLYVTLTGDWRLWG